MKKPSRRNELRFANCSRYQSKGGKDDEGDDQRNIAGEPPAGAHAHGADNDLQSEQLQRDIEDRRGNY